MRLDSGSLLSDALERNRNDERRHALRALLARPLLPVEHPAYALVRRHIDWLRDWLERETGWVVLLDSDHARLLKRSSDHRDASRPARPDLKSGSAPFSRRRYCLLCLALAVLERGENQTALGRLGEGVLQAAGDPALLAAGLNFTLETREERRDLVAVMRLLVELGVVQRVAGDEDAYLDQSGDALYDLNRRILAGLLVATRGPSTLGPDEDGDLETRLAAITETFLPESPEARNRVLRQRLTRRLLDDPVVYWDELTELERNYLLYQRKSIARSIEQAVGLVAEIRAEGMAMVDPDSELSDIHMPSEGTEGHASLLLATYLAEAARQGRETVTEAELLARMNDWIGEFRKYWRKSSREPGGDKELCRHAVDVLIALRLAEYSETGIRPLPAISRYALAEPRWPEKKT